MSFCPKGFVRAFFVVIWEDFWADFKQDTKNFLYKLLFKRIG